MHAFEDVEPGLRLAPLPPRGLLQRVAAWVSKRRLGKVMTPMRVLYPRMPRLFRGQLGLYWLEAKGLALDPVRVHLIEIRASRNTGCSFCADLHQAMALRKGGAQEMLDALDDYETHPAFDEPTRAVLRYVDEMHRDRTVRAATFDALRAHFPERQVCEIVWVYAFTTYLNLMARPLGMTSDGFCALARI